MLANAALWTDPAPFRRRLERSATALIAIRETLARHPELLGDDREALDLYEALRTTPPEAFARVWSDPVCHFWTVGAYRLLGAVLGSAPPSEDVDAIVRAHRSASLRGALAAHVAQLRRAALGAALASGTDVAFARALGVATPLAIPGSRWILAGDRALAVHGIAGGALRVTAGGALHALRFGRAEASAGEAGPALVECPVARTGTYELALNAATFLFPGVDIGAPLHEVPLSFQEEWPDTVSRALDAIAIHQPGTLAQMRAVLRTVALKPRMVGDFTNSSQSDLPGAFVCSTTRDPYVMAYSMIHELHHNRLFYLQEESAVFADRDEGVPDLGTLYSPWRDDPRPPQGILHGLYVYLPVFWFWREALRAGGSRVPRPFAVDQVTRIPAQATRALEQLRAHARFTAAGLELIAELERETALARDAAAAIARPDDAPAIVALDDGSFAPEVEAGGGRPLSVRESLERHAARFAASMA